MINLHTKLEVFLFTHYENIKATQNVKIDVVWRNYGSPTVTDNVTIRY